MDKGRESAAVQMVGPWSAILNAPMIRVKPTASMGGRWGEMESYMIGY